MANTENAGGPSRPLPLSKRLAQIIADSHAERLPFTELAAQLHSRAWGGLLFIFAAINVIPLPPGTSVFFAIPLFHVAPAAAILLFGLALIYRDGALVIIAAVAAVLSLAVDALLVGSGVAAFDYLSSWLHR